MYLSTCVTRAGFSTAAKGAHIIKDEKDVSVDFYNFMVSFLDVRFYF